RGVQRRDRAGRAHHPDGARRGPAAVPVLPAPPPLRAEPPRAPQDRAVRRRPVPGLRRGDARDDLAGARGGARARGRLPAGAGRRRGARGRADRRAPALAPVRAATQLPATRSDPDRAANGSLEAYGFDRREVRTRTIPAVGSRGAAGLGRTGPEPGPAGASRLRFVLAGVVLALRPSRAAPLREPVRRLGTRRR